MRLSTLIGKHILVIVIVASAMVAANTCKVSAQEAEKSPATTPRVAPEVQVNIDRLKVLEQERLEAELVAIRQRAAMNAAMKEIDERREATLKNLTKEEKKAQKELREESKRQARAHEQQQRNQRIGLERADVLGCDVNTMTISARALEYKRFAHTSSVRVFNNKNAPVTIETAARSMGVVVQNLCANGSMTLSFMGGLFRGPYEAEQIELIARGIGQDGKPFESRYLVQIPNQYAAEYQPHNSGSWMIQ